MTKTSLWWLHRIFQWSYLWNSITALSSFIYFYFMNNNFLFNIKSVKAIMCIMVFFFFLILVDIIKWAKSHPQSFLRCFFINTCISFSFWSLTFLNIWKVLCMFWYVPWTAVEFMYKSFRVYHGLIAYISKHLLISTELLLSRVLSLIYNM